MVETSGAQQSYTSAMLPSTQAVHGSKGALHKKVTQLLLSLTLSRIRVADLR